MVLPLKEEILILVELIMTAKNVSMMMIHTKKNMDAILLHAFCHALGKSGQ